MNRIHLLKNPLREYAWGSKTAIAELLGEPIPSERPQAELWMGAHPVAPSQVLCDGLWISLPDWIASNPVGILGHRAALRFSGTLPFLFKVLAADKPLSIQAHPGASAARHGFARENVLGIPLNAPHRNYRDPNHKPELLYALTDFWALNGFRRVSRILDLLDSIPVSSARALSVPLRESPNGKGLKQFFGALMMMEKERQHEFTRDIVNWAEDHGEADPAFEWLIRLHDEYPGDIGVLSTLFLNLVQLKPGDAMFLNSGDLHAYLGGVGLELMANSDNVLRGGLTSKHTDLHELLNTVAFVEKEPVLLPSHMLPGGECVVAAPVEEFRLSAIAVSVGVPFLSTRERSVEILICLRGLAVAANVSTNEAVPMSKGTVIIVPASVEKYKIEGDALLYKASVPL